MSRCFERSRATGRHRAPITRPSAIMCCQWSTPSSKRQRRCLIRQASISPIARAASPSTRRATTRPRWSSPLRWVPSRRRSLVTYQTSPNAPSLSDCSRRHSSRRWSMPVMPGRRPFPGASSPTRKVSASLWRRMATPIAKASSSATARAPARAAKSRPAFSTTGCKAVGATSG